MKKKELVEIIAKVTRAEVRKLIKTEVKKQLTEVLSKKKKVKKFTNLAMEAQSERLLEREMVKPANSLEEALNITEQEQEDWNTVGNFTSADAMRNQFHAMQQPNANPIPMQDVNGQPLNPEKVTPDVMKALTRDYSSLMKHPKMQGKK